MKVAEWPVNVLAERLERIIADGLVEDEERDDLLLLLQRATGESEGSAEPMTRATRLPVDIPAPDLIFEEHVYVFTGKFVTGKRAFCEEAVERLGGWCDSRITRETDYLVIGTLASEAWVHTTHGRKIEAAVEMKAQGHPIGIVAEEHWATALRARS
jgi:NAD-dependent DNA ligase